MSVEDREKWDERYASGEYRPSADPAPVIVRAGECVESGRALVLACGTGRNALYLASLGFEVVAIDISPVAIEMADAEASRSGLTVDWRVGDLDDLNPGERTYDLVTMVRFVNRAIWPRLTPALKSDGWLAMEQHLRTRVPVAGPSQEYRVGVGELLAAFTDVRVIEYSELLTTSTDGERRYATAQLLACKGDPGW